MTETTTATVQTLTAEVRVLKVGSRQITQSVYWQLDPVEFDEIEPFGRVRTSNCSGNRIRMVGAHRETGELVRSSVIKPGYREASTAEQFAAAKAQPLIVLAGLR
jgi:hypothetical protein